MQNAGSRALQSLQEVDMKILNLVTLILVIIGGINWGLMGLAQWDFVAALSGGQGSGLARTVYALVGLSALYQLVPLVKAMKIDEPPAEAASRA
jgi:uncharacterized membrane protein YuzA (DUF378 family)